MKKVMIGILILIPVLILVIVAAISNFLKIAAWIAVDDISVVYKDNTAQEAESISIKFSGDTIEGNFYDFVIVKVMPEYANRYSVEWRISGEVECMDERYQKEYDRYLGELEEYNKYISDLGAIDESIRVINEESDRERKILNEKIAEINADDDLYDREKESLIEDLQYEFDEAQEERDSRISSLEQQKNALKEPDVVEVAPPAMLVDDKGNEVASNTSGKFVINSYCRFNVIIQVENVSRALSVIVEGEDVESITIVNIGEDDNTISVGEKMRVDAKYTPLSSRVTQTRWHSDNTDVATVDQNGVITAHAVGSANITVEANRYNERDEFVTSEVYTVNVVEGVSKFGTQFSTSDSFTLTEIGVAFSDVDRYDGCAIEELTTRVTLTADVAHIITKKGTITVNKCDDNDIVIENADIYSATNGYVFAVSELTLKLRAVWADVLKEGTPDGVSWTANSDGNIVTVVNGEVAAAESGLAQITASREGKTSSILLNVQIKLVSMKLRTDNDYYAVGLALETVFAAERYKDVSVNNEKEANSTLVLIIGAPTRSETDTDISYQSKLAVFYNAYDYEVIDGSEYAHFSDDANEPNRLIFNPSALEGKGKQTLTIKVSAKYPKYESEVKYTTGTVNINVIYGVEVSNIAEFRQASQDQYDYANMDGNLQQSEIGWEHTNTENGRNDYYRYYNSAYSLRTYSISIMTDKGELPYEIQPDGTPLTITDSNSIRVYGDVYGNGNRFSAERNQISDVNSMLWIAWSNVTVSNLNIRANRMEKDGTLSSDETTGLQGECFQVFSITDCNQNRVSGVRIEFCIIENARRAGQTYNADCTFDGLVVRNIDSTALYIPARMNTYNENGQFVTYPNFSHINMNNCVFSNCISTIGSYSYERFTVMPSASTDGSSYTDCTAGDGRFVRDDAVANAEYFKKYFMAAGVNTQIRQTGFLDVYNWQNVQNANLIDTGDSSINDIISSFAGDILKYTDEFSKCRYDGDDGMYFHMGILTSGISFGEGIFDEPSYLDVTFEDERFVTDPIRTRNLPEKPSSEMSGLAAAATMLLRDMEIVFYGYASDKVDITPYSTFEINAKFIAHLHGQN